MARIDTLANFLTDVATAIKNKKGDTTPITPSNFDTEINNLPSGGSEEYIPTKGFIVNEWDEVTSGDATKITFYGNNVPSYACASYNTTYCHALNRRLETVVLSDTITSVGQYAFYRCANLKKINLDNMTNIGQYAFSYCSSLNIKTIPDGITGLLTYCEFANCTGITQLSMKNVKNISANSASRGTFYNCTGLKAVWIGSAITSDFHRYAFQGCTNLTKMFIDKPRATVEKFTNYQYTFMNDTTKTGIIICNDDEGFMTKEEFDAIDWATYTS